MGGVGRTGMVAACALVRAGLDADAAISLVRKVRHPTAVETAGQEAFVRRYAAER
jgi:protein-tyrosine phosphatase